MRYAQSETTNILGVFNSGDSVTIDIYRLSDNSKVVDAAPCTEIGTTGVFKYEFSQAVSQKEEFLWIMSNGEYSKYGKVILGGYMDDIKATITDHRDVVEPKIDTTISSRASQESVNAIPTNPLLDNDPRLDNLDVAVSSRLASNDSRLDNLDAPISSRSSHTPADVWNYSTRELTNPDNYKADVSDLAKESTVQAIKSRTDKLKFNDDNDVIATLDGEVVNLTSETESQIDNIEANVTNPDQYKADISSLALQSTLEQVKSQTDKLQFDDNNFVKANAQNPELSNLDTTVSSRASQTSVDAIPTNPLLDNDPRLDNLDTRISSRSSHTPADIWNYNNRTLTSSVSLTDSDKDDIANKVWDEPISEHVIDGTFGQKNQKAVPSEDINDYKADTSNLAKQDTVQAIKDQTDKLTFDSNNNVVATLNDDLQTTLSLILGLVQHNYKLYNTEYVTIKGVKKLSSALIRIYPTKEDLQNDANPLKAYSLNVEYDKDGNIKSYTCTESD
ncbi:MAG: hypothetical protein DRI57_05290 [Deltaproteobacteria bacterium]|nr:MAG: hypothetical protein DRI57_05290 [Deltaproteobacteria bacterium]